MHKNVWIVDDDEGILEVTKIVLEEAGFTVRDISTAELLYSEIKKTLPDLILLDLLLSGTDGREICQRLKQNSATRQVPVVLMSADTQIQEKFREAGADDYIKKPFDIEELEGIVRKHLF